MPYVSSREMLQSAHAGGWAVGAFNAENMEMAQAIIAAAESARSPVMLQTTTGTLGYAPAAVFSGIVRALAKQARVPVALHLDHASRLDLVREALEGGYSSVMIDGSALAFEANVKLTREAAAICAHSGTPVEGELGHVGGKEDGAGSEGRGFTDPDEAEAFIRRTGIDSLAIGVGTAHGVYTAPPDLQLDLIAVLRRRLPVPLVLHGASGLSDAAIGACIRNGISKVNFATELRQAYTAAVRGVLTGDAKVFDPKKYGAAGRAAVQAAVEARMRVCGCTGKA